MTNEQHTKRLGRLLANLHTLEFSLRAFLQSLINARPLGFPHGTNVYTFPVGSVLPENEFTSYETLGNLIARYNNHVRPVGGATLDAELVTLRDALAHGRIASPSQDAFAPFHLLKFSKAENGNVRVTFNEAMTMEWFDTNIQRVKLAWQEVQSRIAP